MAKQKIAAGVLGATMQLPKAAPMAEPSRVPSLLMPQKYSSSFVAGVSTRSAPARHRVGADTEIGAFSSQPFAGARYG